MSEASVPAGPFSRDGTRVLLPGGRAGFDVAYCPRPEMLAALIVAALNCHVPLLTLADIVCTIRDEQMARVSSSAKLAAKRRASAMVYSASILAEADRVDAALAVVSEAANSARADVEAADEL